MFVKILLHASSFEIFSVFFQFGERVGKKIYKTIDRRKKKSYYKCNTKPKRFGLKTITKRLTTSKEDTTCH